MNRVASTLVSTMLTAALSLGLMSGCGQSAGTGTATGTNTGNAAAGSAAHTSGDTIDKLIVAYLPNEATDDLAEVRNVMSAQLTEYLGIPVEEFVAADYNAVVEAMRTGKIHMAYFGPLTYVDAADRAGAQALAVVALDRDKSRAGYQSHFIVKADSDIQSLEDLRDRDFAFVDPSSTSGNLVPTKELMDHFGLSNEDLHANGKFFASVMYSGSHQNGLQAVLRGDVDAAPISSDILVREISAGNIREGDVRIIHSSPTIPASPMGVRGDMPQELKDKIQQFLLSYEDDEYFVLMMGQEEGQYLRFVEATESEYEYVRQMKNEVQ